MSKLGTFAAYAGASAAGATAHMASAARYLDQHLSPVIAQDLREIEQHGRLPHVANPFPQPGAVKDSTVIRTWLKGALIGAAIGVPVIAILGAWGASWGGQAPLAGMLLGFFFGPVIGGIIGLAYAAFVMVPRMHQSRFREQQRVTMSRYWEMREHLRTGLDEGTISPAEAMLHIEPWRFPDAA